MQVRHTRCPLSGLSMRTTLWQPGQAGWTTPATPAVCRRSISRRMARRGERCPSPASRPGSVSRAQASFCWSEGRAADRRTASAITSRSAAGSRAVTTLWMTVIGSRPSTSGHILQRGRPARSRFAMRRVFPQAAQGSSCRPHLQQYQSCPRRLRVRIGLPQSAQHGGEMCEAPASRSAMSRSPMALGAGERPSVSTPGRSARCEARRRAFARPPARLVTMVRICSIAS